jgi:two-component system, NtrC family, sensor histidine kinase HydH
MHPVSLAASPARPFNLSRWFALTALVTIAVLAIAFGALLNRFMTQRLLWQEAVLTKEFVQSLVQVERSLQTYFQDPSHGLDDETAQAFKHIAALPDMLRANIYDPQRKLIWSSDGRLMAQALGPNDELDHALRGGVVSKMVDPGHHGKDKVEHQGLEHPNDQFVEIYVPIYTQNAGRVLAVVEFYKNPRTLMTALSELRLYLALGSVAAAAVLFLALFGLVRRADRTIRQQQRQLVEAETMAVIGEMSTAVAHGIRNPLASIRSSAELIQDGSLEEARQSAGDIVAQSDRLEVWVRELLAYTRPLDEAGTAVELGPLVRQCLDSFSREIQRRQIRVHAQLPDELPAVRGHTLLLGQVLTSILANAVEAMDGSGEITVRGEWARGDTHVTLSVADTGPGMSEAQRQRAGRPFHTTKPRGLGVGLALARRVLERFGGLLEIASVQGQGTTVRLHLLSA